MTKKRMMKLMMANGVSRNEARVWADACNGDMPHVIMLFAVLVQPEVREIVRPCLMQIMTGTSFSVRLEAGAADE